MKKILFLYLIVLVVFNSCSKKEEVEVEEKEEIVKVVEFEGNEMLKSIAPKRQHFFVFKKGGEVTGKRGTRLKIPEYAFDLNYDEMVTGDPINVYLTEMIDTHEMIASGVPLTYEENGEEMLFESAGMFRVEAYYNEKPLKLATGKKIEVQFPNNVPGDKFWVYKMNEDGKWVKDGHNQEDAPVEEVAYASPEDERAAKAWQKKYEKYRKKTVGVRKYEISELTYYNWDYPRSYFGVVKFKVSGGEFIQGFIMAVNSKVHQPVYRSSFDNEYYIARFLGNKYVRILVLSIDGKVGISNVFKMSMKQGDMFQAESETNYYQDIGTIKFEKVNEDILGDAEKFKQYLKVKDSEYKVKYAD